MMFVDQKYPHDNSANERLNDYVCKPWYHDEYECLLIFCSPNMGRLQVHDDKGHFIINWDHVLKALS